MDKNLTANEKDVLLAIINNDYQYFDTTNREMIGSPTWTFVCEDSGLKGKTLSGVISSLNKKGFVESHEDGKDSTIWILEDGFKALNK